MAVLNWQLLDHHASIEEKAITKETDKNVIEISVCTINNKLTKVQQKDTSLCQGSIHSGCNDEETDYEWH